MEGYIIVTLSSMMNEDATEQAPSRNQNYNKIMEKGFTETTQVNFCTPPPTQPTTCSPMPPSRHLSTSSPRKSPLWRWVPLPPPRGQRYFRRGHQAHRQGRVETAGYPEPMSEISHSACNPFKNDEAEMLRAGDWPELKTLNLSTPWVIQTKTTLKTLE